jgi:hypothetical protein
MATPLPLCCSVRQFPLLTVKCSITIHAWPKIQITDFRLSSPVKRILNPVRGREENMGDKKRRWQDLEGEEERLHMKRKRQRRVIALLNISQKEGEEKRVKKEERKWNTCYKKKIRNRFRNKKRKVTKNRAQKEDGKVKLA